MSKQVVVQMRINVHMNRHLILCSLLSCFLLGVGCNARKQVVLGTSNLNSNFTAQICKAIGIDDAAIYLRIISNGETNYYLVQFSSYPGFPSTHLSLKYSESKKTLWVIGHPSGGERFIAAFVLEGGYFYDKHGRMLHPSKSSDIRTPEYRSGAIPDIADDAKEVLTIQY